MEIFKRFSIRFKSNIFLFFLFVFLACIPILWFSDGLIALHSDFVFPLTSLSFHDLVEDSFMWNEVS